MQLLTDDILHAIFKLNLPTRFQNKLKHDIEYILNKCHSNVYEIRIFGSCATGQYRASSDIDLLIIAKEKMEDRTLRGEIQESLDEPMDGVSTDVVFYTVQSFLEAQDLFSRELRKESYLLWKRG